MTVPELESRALKALNTLTDLSWEYGQTPTSGERIFFDSELSRLQQRHIGYLYNETGLLCEIAKRKEGKAVMGVISGFDVKKLESLAKREAQRKQEGPDAAEALSKLTGVEWEWSGFNLVTKEDVFTDPDYELSEKIDQMVSDGSITTATKIISLERGDGKSYAHGCVDTFNLEKLNELLGEQAMDKPEAKLLAELAESYNLDFQPSSNEDSLGNLIVNEKHNFEGFSSIPVLDELSNQGIINYTKSTSGYLTLDVKDVDTEALSKAIKNNLKRQNNLAALCDEDLGDGHMMSHMLGDMLDCGHFVYDGMTLSHSIPVDTRHFKAISIEELLNPKRRGSAATYTFLATLKELEERGAVNYFIDTDQPTPTVYITSADPELVKAASTERDLQEKAMQRFNRPALTQKPQGIGNDAATDLSADRMLDIGRGPQ